MTLRYNSGMTNTRTWESFITPAMESDARRQASKLVANGSTVDAAAMEASAWIAVKAKRSAMIANLPKRANRLA